MVSDLESSSLEVTHRTLQFPWAGALPVDSGELGYCQAALCFQPLFRSRGDCPRAESGQGERVQDRKQGETQHHPGVGGGCGAPPYLGLLGSPVYPSPKLGGAHALVLSQAGLPPRPRLSQHPSPPHLLAQRLFGSRNSTAPDTRGCRSPLLSAQPKLPLASWPAGPQLPALPQA